MRNVNIEFVMKTVVEVGWSQEVGNAPTGLRRIIPITGGTFKGEKISGTIFPGGLTGRSSAVMVSLIWKRAIPSEPMMEH